MDIENLINNLQLVSSVIPDYVEGRNRGLTDDKCEEVAFEAIQQAIETFEKQIAKKVKEHYNWCDFTEEEKLENHHWFCENCTAPVEENYNYCPECGQKLDWN